VRRAPRAALLAVLLGSLPYAAILAATVAERLHEFGRAARERLAPSFARAGVAYPPAAVTLVGLKREGLLDVYAQDRRAPWRFVRSYEIQAASGVEGPKLRAGDRQVPEGIYGVELLNPNSRFHVSLRVGYPNSFDRRMARADGRRELGGDIMIHGNRVSIGCLAMGDPAAEELFTLAADVGLGHVKVILAPADLRHARAPASRSLPSWTATLYRDVGAALAELPEPRR
jgi:L,D-transpeptidase-like protein